MQRRATGARFVVTTSPIFVSIPLDPTIHDVTQFDCGQADLDTWLYDNAVTAARARVAQTFVWLHDDDSDVVVAYYALSAHAIPRAKAPSRIGRGVPDPVPAALLAKLALIRALQGRGLGEVLLVDALQRILLASDQGPAVRAVVVDAATDAGRALYVKFGFVAAPGRADRMMIRAETIAQALRPKAT